MEQESQSKEQMTLESCQLLSCNFKVLKLQEMTSKPVAICWLLIIFIIGQ